MRDYKHDMREADRAKYARIELAICLVIFAMVLTAIYYR